MMFPRPSPDTGLGLHDSADVYANPPDFARHARAMRAAGLSWYKVLASDTNKVERCRVYLAHGIMPIVRLYVPRPHPDWLPNHDIVRAYTAVGVRYFEIGNEPNLDEEWREGKWTSSAGLLCKMLAEQWIQGSRIVKESGGIPLMFAMTPGGHVNHRTVTNGILAQLATWGALSSMEGAGVGIHPRPLNNPPDSPRDAGDPPNTTTFLEYEWYIQAYVTYGLRPPFFATEHGYSPGSSEHGGYPRIDDTLWARYNRELFERMNPAHPKAVPPQLWALCYWLETEGTNWGHDVAFKGWMEPEPRGDDPSWGKTIYLIKPGWDRGRQEEEEVGIISKPSNHHSSRNGQQIKHIIVHSTASPAGSSAAATAEYLRQNDRGVSIHELAGAGVVYLMVAMNRAAHHCESESVSLPGTPAALANEASWGIELFNIGSQPVAAGIVTLGVERVVQAIKKINASQGHQLSSRDVLGHGEIDPSRRADPVGVDMAAFRRRVAEALGETISEAVAARLKAVAKERQRLSHNPRAALQAKALADGWATALSDEFAVEGYQGQLFVHPKTGEERVYYARQGDWGNVRWLKVA